MWPDRLSNPGPLANESDMLLFALHGLAKNNKYLIFLTGTDNDDDVDEDDDDEDNDEPPEKQPKR